MFTRVLGRLFELRRDPAEQVALTVYIDRVVPLLTREGEDRPPTVQLIADVIVLQGNYMNQKNEFNGPVTAGVIGRAEVGTLAQNNAVAYGPAAQKIDLVQLAAELEAIRRKAAGEATQAGHYADLASVASAEESARKGDRSGSLGSLAKAGSWFWDVATKVGIGVATALAKDALDR